MALTINTPTTSTYYYAAYDGSAMLTLNNIIAFEQSGSAEDVTIDYSLDAGSTWETAIDASVSATGGDTEDSYNWSLDYTEYGNIFTGTDTEVDIVIRVTGNSSSDTDNVACKIRKVPFTSILPNYSLHGSNQLYYKSPLNIMWSELYDSSITNVKIEWEYYDGGWTTGAVIIASTANDGGYVLDDPSAHITQLGSAIRFKISAVDDTYASADWTECWYYSDITGGTTGVIFSDDYDDVIIPDSSNEYHPYRLELGNRVSGEKAVFHDEFISLSQLEAGTNITITQRDKNGQISGVDRAGNAVDDPFAAYNIRIDGPERPRELQGTLDYITDAAVTEISRGNAGAYYGKVYRLTIAHNWSLDGSVHTGQNQWSYHLEIEQRPKVSGEQVNEPQVWWEPAWGASPEDNIYVYCVLKGDAVNQDTTPDDMNSFITLTKDKVTDGIVPGEGSDVDTGEYYFHWKLKEIIP
jgi:hypothetical protein